ncbi:SDR family NAD(P)-dependent oxidoreductase [Actinophytocola algeriensis]|uniref:NAD(P)-dependent dehydrogenase (Short-subunit alcohol dehydrogenase family) n=1 Tax=Actinophytocola algeriensis TaxID=1768010 RepID=A0A7W7VI04_9PSEU|nr:SDR family NAD(P)-dependent oxidoreductase [Actinophytocola algeriensis]MBB4910784.1 NAD(P)-dependent dehydrogenase (short-subunit alcohol dehydrogenase family) [Actinophytocola algeriensis]MBE1473777.1 NAD(P)-dependent dehydrogenase (short-subunit alcohol dehydrogenase family) [Actinophytocola algeriensis]
MRTWFITGASRGLGQAFTEAALAEGDRVVAVSRTIEPREDDRVLAFRLDVTDRDAVHAAVDRAVAHFGRLDVVVNNAGYLAMGMVEEFTEEEARAQLDVNFFGPLWVTQAVLPHLRGQGGGHLVQISSIGALGGFPLTGLYSASKFALEGMSEALAAEAAGFGVKTTIVEPGGYWTDLYLSGLRATTPHPDYADLRAELEKQFSAGSKDSMPELAARGVLELVRSDDPPLRLLLGDMVYDLAVDTTNRKLATWAEWEHVSRAAEQAVPPPAGYGVAVE